MRWHTHVAIRLDTSDAGTPCILNAGAIDVYRPAQAGRFYQIPEVSAVYQ